jgi:hypothetical protein
MMLMCNGQHNNINPSPITYSTHHPSAIGEVVLIMTTTASS